MLLLFALALLASEPATTCRNGTQNPADASEDRSLLKSGPGLWIGGRAFRSADVTSTEVSFGDYDNYPIIRLVFSRSGQAKFLAIQKGRVGKELPIFVDGQMISCPMLYEMILGGEIHISGGLSAEQAAILTTKIKS